MKRLVLGHRGIARVYIATDDVLPPLKIRSNYKPIAFPNEDRPKVYVYDIMRVPVNDVGYPAVVNFYPGYHGHYSTRVNPMATCRNCTVVKGAFKPGELLQVSSPEGNYHAVAVLVIPLNDTGEPMFTGKNLITLLDIPANECSGVGTTPLSAPLSTAAILTEVTGGPPYTSLSATTVLTEGTALAA